MGGNNAHAIELAVLLSGKQLNFRNASISKKMVN
jgi:hypothetical protein